MDFQENKRVSYMKLRVKKISLFNSTFEDLRLTIVEHKNNDKENQRKWKEIRKSFTWKDFFFLCKLK